jgi:hypothetical protein
MEVAIEFLQDVSETGASCFSDFADVVVAEFEEHGEELIVNGL